MKYKLLLLVIIGSMLNIGCSDLANQYDDDTPNPLQEEQNRVIPPMGPNDCADEFGNTDLMLATIECDVEEVERLLLLPGMCVHPKNKRGEDAIAIANRKIRQGETDCEEVLVLLENHREGEYDDDHADIPLDCRGNTLDNRQNNRIIPPIDEVGDRQNRIIPPIDEVGDRQNRIIPPMDDPTDDIFAGTPTPAPPFDVTQDPVSPLGPVQEPSLPEPPVLAERPDRPAQETALPVVPPVEIVKTDNQDTTIARERQGQVGPPPRSTDDLPTVPRRTLPPQEPVQDTTVAAVPKRTPETYAPSVVPKRPVVVTPEPAVPDTTRTPEAEPTNVGSDPGSETVVLPKPSDFIPIPPIKQEVLESDTRVRNPIVSPRPTTTPVATPQENINRRHPAPVVETPTTPVAPTPAPVAGPSPNNNVNLKDTFGKTLLMWAVEDGKLDLVRNLLENSITDVNAKDNNGETALLIATKKGNDEIVKLLLTREDIDVNAYDNMGRSPLMAAASAGYIEILYLLIVRPELAINHTLHLEKETALMQAVTKRHVTAVKILLTHENIDSSIRDYLGVSPIDFARRINNKDLITVLEEHENK